LSIGRAPGRGFLLRDLAALILHLAAIEAHREVLKAKEPYGADLDRSSQRVFKINGRSFLNVIYCGNLTWNGRPLERVLIC
jgi:hypothetical protein